MTRKIILALAAAFALAAFALTAAYFYIPGGARLTFGEGDVHVCLNADGTVDLDWPEAGRPSDVSASARERAVFYSLDVQSGEDHIEKYQSAPGVSLGKTALPMTLRVQAEAEGKNLLGLYRKLTSRPLEVEVAGADLTAPEVVGTPGPATLSLSWTHTGQVPGFYKIFALDRKTGIFRQAATTSARQIDLNVYKEGGSLVLPSYEHPLEINVRAAVQGEGYVLCGPASNLIRVERQDLLGDDLNLVYRETTPLTYTLEWDETRGEYYEVQEWSPEGWTLLDTLDPAESFAYDLGRLGSGSRHRFQVVSRDKNGTVRSTEEAAFSVSVAPLYATIWPIVDQPFYERADKGSASLGKLPGGTALCVLEESGDWFQVRYKDQYGWVDSRFCMINLPEYVGDHCSYDIANSYSSIFKVHENPIALITDQVVKGFEHVQEADGQFLVPYLYPCAKKLLSAAQAAEADGYRLKIYEAFRPNEATRFLYDTTAAQLDWAALVYSDEDPEGRPLGEDEDPRILDPVTGWEVDLADGLLIDPETGEKISREDLALRQAENPENPEEAPDGPGGLMLGAVVPETEEPEGTDDPSQPFFTLPAEGEGGSLDPAEPPPEPVPQPEPAPQPESPSETPPQEGEPLEAGIEGEEEPEPETYFQIMTNNGRFGLGSFLAKVASAHNRGIALDLTLEKIDSGEELEMQSAIHDLSWYSAAYLNNDNAKLLEKYMTATGMRGLSSEWWHFQDDETREAIGLTSYLFKGVDMKGWTRDARGWRYRDADGTIFKDTAVTVDGKRYTADRDGYIQQ